MFEWDDLLCFLLVVWIGSLRSFRSDTLRVHKADDLNSAHKRLHDDNYYLINILNNYNYIIIIIIIIIDIGIIEMSTESFVEFWNQDNNN